VRPRRANAERLERVGGGDGGGGGRQHGVDGEEGAEDVDDGRADGDADEQREVAVFGRQVRRRRGLCVKERRLGGRGA